VHGGTIEWSLVTDWSSLVVPPPMEADPFDIGGIAEIKARYGLDEVAKLHWNENLFGPLPGVLEAVRDELDNVWMYPEEGYQGFREEAAAFVGTDSGGILPGHGTQSLIGVLATTFLRPGDAVAVPELTFYLYARACAARGAVVERAPMRGPDIDLEALAETARRTDARMVWVCDPNNPTGAVLDAGEWAAFLDGLPDRCVAVVDEAYVDYVPTEQRVQRVADIGAGRLLVLLRSFSKFFGLAGLRLGYVIAPEALVPYLAIVEEPYNVNCAALAAGRACLRAGAAADDRRRDVAEARETLSEGMRAAGLEPLPSETNFVLARVDVDEAALADGLAARGILIRPGSDVGLPGHVRITVGPVPLMNRVAADLREVCAGLRA
jgi:histidinol-phosphate aminotransferase